MSQGLEAVREVYLAGGRVPVSRLAADDDALCWARQRGLLEPVSRGGRRHTHFAVITQRGRDLIEGRLKMYVPYTPAQPNGGRAKGTHRRFIATWLASLPRTNEVRI